MRASLLVTSAFVAVTLLLLLGSACGLNVVGTSGTDPSMDDDGGRNASDGNAGTESDANVTKADDGSVSVDVDGSTSDASGDAAALGCGTTMARVTSGGAAALTPYCIDKLEVTEQQYAQFKAASVSSSVLPLPACSTKLTFRPGSARGAMRPVSDVDWCDAWAFCNWTGKRLCSVGEWQNACNDGTGLTFPYGNTFNDATCNGGPLNTPVDVGSLAGCHGPIARLMDMSGNMDEWSSGCSANTGLGDLCKTHGGDWQNDGASELMCASTQDRTRSLAAVHIGFRCCK